MTQEQDKRRVLSSQDAFFNAQFNANPVEVFPGQCMISKQEDDMLVGTLGAGVAISVHDPFLRITGMASVLMPSCVIDDFPIFKAQDQSQIKSAMEPFDQCFHALEPKYTGKSRIQIRLSGCAGLSDDERDCGTKTLVIVKEYLARKGIRVMGQDIGGEHIRRIHVMPTSGHIVKRLLRRDSDVVYLKNLEAEYQNKFQSFLKSTAL
jgi:chemotaxis receptor (MCP) glutamine deamidase CheD